MSHLPPFSALRVFETVSRTKSFTLAAKRLGVTQAAVSRQIKSLEEYLGVVLIDRCPDGNELTSKGRILSDGVRRGLIEIEEAVSRVSASPGRTALTVSVAPFFSSNWLSPRLTGFVSENPQVEIRLHHAYQPPDFRRDQFELGVNWGPGKWPNVSSEKFIDGSLVAVCSPSFLKRLGPNLVVEELINQPLFCEFARSDWNTWFEIAGVEPGKEINVTLLDDSHALRRVAFEGHGVALFFKSMIQEELLNSRLVQLFDISIDTGSHYYLNYPCDRELSAVAKRFRRWLLDEQKGTVT